MARYQLGQRYTPICESTNSAGREIEALLEQIEKLCIKKLRVAHKGQTQEGGLPKPNSIHAKFHEAGVDERRLSEIGWRKAAQLALLKPQILRRYSRCLLSHFPNLTPGTN